MRLRNAVLTLTVLATLTLALLGFLLGLVAP